MVFTVTHTHLTPIKRIKEFHESAIGTDYEYDCVYGLWYFSAFNVDRSQLERLRFQARRLGFSHNPGAIQ